MNLWSLLTVAFFFVIFAIQFALFYMLYKALRRSMMKITDVESLMSVTAERVMSLKEKTPIVTYQEVIRRLKDGESAENISKDLNVDILELEALERILKAVQEQRAD